MKVKIPNLCKGLNGMKCNIYYFYPFLFHSFSFLFHSKTFPCSCLTYLLHCCHILLPFTSTSVITSPYSHAAVTTRDCFELPQTSMKHNFFFLHVFVSYSYFSSSLLLVCYFFDLCNKFHTSS